MGYWVRVTPEPNYSTTKTTAAAAAALLLRPLGRPLAGPARLCGRGPPAAVPAAGGEADR